jgi:hypothetical protein
VSPSQHTAYLAPALCMFCLLSVVLPASPSVRFLEQARAGHERSRIFAGRAAGVECGGNCYITMQMALQH